MPNALASVANPWSPHGAAAQAERAQALRSKERAPSAGVVAAVKTEISTAQASSLLANAVEKVTGEPATPECTALLTAQWAHETGHGASMYNYNFGGIKGRGPTGLSVACRTREGYGATEVTIVDRFRAYGTAAEGAEDYVSLLATRYPDALAAARKGDPSGMVRALKQGGYFTGEEGAYTRSVTRIAERVLPDDVELVDAPPPPALAYTPAAPGLGASGDAGHTPFIGALALSDAVSRVALEILADTARERGLYGEES